MHICFNRTTKFYSPQISYDPNHRLSHGIVNLIVTWVTLVTDIHEVIHRFCWWSLDSTKHVFIARTVHIARNSFIGNLRCAFLARYLEGWYVGLILHHTKFLCLEKNMKICCTGVYLNFFGVYFFSELSIEAITWFLNHTLGRMTFTLKIDLEIDRIY